MNRYNVALQAADSGHRVRHVGTSHYIRSSALLVCGSVAALLCVPQLAVAEVTSGPLADYVAKDDGSYGWVKLREGKFGATSFTELILTSQTWRDIVWKHQVYIIRPSNLSDGPQQGVLVISGGGWRDAYEHPEGPLKMPKEAALFAMIADKFQSPVVVLKQVPQQPLFGGKVEDAIIAMTFENFIKTGDVEWPLLLPMVKSAVRAMDAVQEVCRREWDMDVPAFTVTGASKRGWTTWLTGAVDKRATAIAPMVIDTLNMRPQMKHQLDAWGAFSEQIHDYTERGLQEALATDAGDSLRDIVDPYSYRHVLEQPKLIMIGTNDRYWPLDALNLYWQDLIGEKYILYLPNNRHGLRDYPRMIGTLWALHQEAKGESHLPHLPWKVVPGDKSVSLRVETDRKPRKIQVWLATSKTRDFRDARWSSQPTEKEGGAHVYDLERPASGYAAMFGEAVYDGDSFPFFLSTNVRIVASDKRAGRAGEGKSL